MSRITRSGRTSKAPIKLSRYEEHIEYSIPTARVIAKTMDYMSNGVRIEKKQVNHQFVQTYTLMKGMKHFGNKGKEAAMNEMKQLHERNVSEPVRIEDLNNNERKRAMESLIFLVEKRDGTVKGRACTNGSVQRPYIA
jgi:ribulose bisphosphate carboxylase small subunit